MMYIKRLLLLWLTMVMFSGGLKSQVYTDHIVRNFKTSPNTTVEVVNKYGKVHVQTWDKDSVRFVIDLRVQTTSTQKLQKLKSQLKFDFTPTNYYIVAKTEFTKSGGVFSDMVESFVPSNTVTINYMVFLPETSSLKLINKFGDVYIDDFSGNLDISLSNGNLKANMLKGNTSIKLTSGDGMVYGIEKGTLEIGSSDFEVKKAGDLHIESRSSNIEIRKAGKIKIASKYDNFYIDDIQEISGDGYFTSVSLTELKEELSSNMKYGEVAIQNIVSSFSLVNINSSYTDIELNFGPNSKYNVDISHNKDVHLTYPSEIDGLETKELGEDMFLTYGLVGTKNATNVPKVKIIADKKCYINIYHR